jgi:hypothetical protein
MDQFIREVDEEYRRHRAAEIWRRYSALIVGLALALILGVAGWRYWEYRQVQLSEAASARYDAALDLAREGRTDEAEKALAALAAEAPPGYQLLARFRLAAEKGKDAPEEGAQAYDALAKDAGLTQTLRDLARLRAAMLRLEGEQGDAARRELEQLASPNGAWRHTARELLGVSALRRGDAEAASRWFDQIAQDRNTPQGLRGRLEIYAALAAGGAVQTTQ